MRRARRSMQLRPPGAQTGTTCAGSVAGGEGAGGPGRLGRPFAVAVPAHTNAAQFPFLPFLSPADHVLGHRHPIGVNSQTKLSASVHAKSRKFLLLVMIPHAKRKNRF